jgi:uncharacterized membrane protein YgdD (TMEM256/DUF423 family)
MRCWLIIAALGGFSAVGLGAFGAHLLQAALPAHEMALFETAVRYQMWHSLALMGVALAMGKTAAHQPALTVSAWAFAAGMVLFCGALYTIALTGSRAFAPLAPLGGAAFLLGWASLALAAWRRA